MDDGEIQIPANLLDQVDVFYPFEVEVEESEPEETSEESSEEEDDNQQMNSEQADAEDEIEGDFERLVAKIRQQDTGSMSSNLLSKEWDFNVEDKDAEFRDDLRAASGVGKRRGKQRGRRTGLTLSLHVKSILGEGNQAYIEGDIQHTISLMQEAIRIEPRAANAWTVLAQCYDDLKDSQKALQARIMAAHLRHDAEEWEHLARQSRELGHNQQALYCYRKLCSLDPNNINAFWDRAALAKEIGAFRTAKNAYMVILKRFPNDFTILRELHTIMVELGELEICASLLQEALDHHIFKTPSSSDPAAAGPMDLLLLADLHNAVGDHIRAAQVIRQGTRWLQGRSSQRFWDISEDDREYDKEGWPPRPNAAEGVQITATHYELDTNARHRLAVARIKMGDIEEGKLHATTVLSEDVLDYSVLFTEIADAYFDKELYEEARPIYELLGADPATSSVYILMQTAACMRNSDDLKDAAEVYEHVRLADPGNNDAKMKLAEIYEIMNEPRRALDLVYEVIDSRKKGKKSGPRTSTPSDSLQPESPAGAFLPTTSLFTEEKPVARQSGSKQNQLTRQQLKELETQKEKEVIRNHRRLKDIWSAMLAGEEVAYREWMLEAEKLVDMFRETRNLFLTSRNNPFRGMFPRQKKRRTNAEEDEDQMASRLQLDIERDAITRKAARSGEKPVTVDVFRGITFDEWLRLFMQYCFNLTLSGQATQAGEILRHILVSNAYQTRERQDSIRLALITCAIHAHEHPAIVEHCRKLINAHQFNNEPLRILVASLASGLKNTDSFITSTLQKHLFREIKLGDLAVKNPTLLKWNPANKRYASVIISAQNKKGRSRADGSDDDEDDEGVEQGSQADGSTAGSTTALPLPTKLNPVLVAIYGQVCIAAKSYQSAIFYLLHAFDYYPNDPMICLCLAIASIGRAMQRQSDNRHHLVVQAMAFLKKYRDLRGSSASDASIETREIEYNFGRTFHQLGLYSHAVKHYEKVLELAENANDDMFTKEAAYNLSMIFVLTGATPLADALYQRWLSI